MERNFLHFYPCSLPTFHNYPKTAPNWALFWDFKVFNVLIYNTFIYQSKSWRISNFKLNHLPLRALFGCFFNLLSSIAGLQSPTPFGYSLFTQRGRFYFSDLTFDNAYTFNSVAGFQFPTRPCEANLCPFLLSSKDYIRENVIFTA